MVAWKAIRRLTSEKSGDFRQRRQPVVEEDGHNQPASNSDVPLRPAEPHLEDSSGLPVRGQVKWFNASKGYGFVQLSDGTLRRLSARPLDRRPYLEGGGGHGQVAH